MLLRSRLHILPSNCTDSRRRLSSLVTQSSNIASIMMSSQDFFARILDLCTSLNLFSIPNLFARSLQPLPYHQLQLLHLYRNSCFGYEGFNAPKLLNWCRFYLTNTGYCILRSSFSFSFGFSGDLLLYFYSATRFILCRQPVTHPS